MITSGLTIQSNKADVQNYVPIFDIKDYNDVIHEAQTQVGDYIKDTVESFGKGVGSGLGKDAKVNVGFDVKTLIVPAVVLVAVFLIIK